MDPLDAYAALPESYRVLLRLRQRGHPETVIADALGVDPAVIPSMTRVAVAKLAELGEPLRTEQPPCPDD